MACSSVNAPACVRRRVERCAPQPRQLPQLVGDRPHVAAGGDGHRKGCGVALERGQLEVVDGDASRLYCDFRPGSRQFVRCDAVNLLRGEDGRKLIDLAVKPVAQRSQFFKGLGQRPRICCGGAFGIKGVGGEAEADVAGVVLVRLPEELGEPGVLAEQQRQNSGSHRVERAEVADGFLASSAADDSDYIVRGDAGGFVENKKTIHAATSLVAKTSSPDAEPERGTHSASATAT